MRSVNRNTHLGVVGAAEAKLFDSTTEQNNPVHVSTAVFGVLDSDLLRGYGSRSAKPGRQQSLLINHHTRSSDLVPLCMNIGSFGAGRCENLEDGVIIAVSLLDLDVVSGISLGLQGLDGSLQRCRRTPEVLLNAETVLDELLLLHLVGQNILDSGDLVLAI